MNLLSSPHFISKKAENFFFDFLERIKITSTDWRASCKHGSQYKYSVNFDIFFINFRQITLISCKIDNQLVPVPFTNIRLFFVFCRIIFRYFCFKPNGKSHYLVSHRSTSNIFFWFRAKLSDFIKKKGNKWFSIYQMSKHFICLLRRRNSSSLSWFRPLKWKSKSTTRAKSITKPTL